MALKDKIVSWFVQNIVIPKVENIDNPGFITITTTTGRESINIRELFVPENLMAEIERRVAKEGVKNEKMLYYIGKKFGHVYAEISGFPTIECKKEEFLKFVYFLVRWVESTYAKNISHKIEYESKVFAMKTDNYIICRKNGIGYLLGSGGVAGIWSYMTCDTTVEGIQIKCVGRGDPECEIICAPYKILLKMGHTPIVCKEMESYKLDKTYLEINKTRTVKWARHSLKNLIDGGVFDYSHGQVTFKDERFFLCEASMIYILEKELGKLKHGKKILWETSFDWGKILANEVGKQDVVNFIADFFPSIGFGDILVKTKPWKLVVNYFPWTKWADDIDFIMFRGMLSGVISGMTGKKVELKKVNKTISDNGFSLVIEE